MKKTSIQARCRCHPTLPPGKARAMRIEHGLQARWCPGLAWPPGTSTAGRWTGRSEHTDRGSHPFSRLAEQVMNQPKPYASTNRVFWIVDKRVFPPRCCPDQTDGQGRGRTRTWIHLPAHASWLDQAGIYFSILQRKALTPSDFISLDQIRERLAAFETRYNTIARPFSWNFTHNDLEDLLHRIDAHDNRQPHALAA